jgi:hypothetical protein
MPPNQGWGETWTVPDVLLITEGKEGRVAVPHLELAFVESGIEVSRLNGAMAWQCLWSDLDELSTAEHSVLPDGSEGLVVLVGERGGLQHRFIVPTNEPSEVEQMIREVAHAHRIHTRMPAQAAPRSLTVAVVVATVATLTVLLLAAAHVIHF